MANGTYKAYAYISNPASLKNTKDYGKFEYDPMKDVNYQQLAKVYNANGIKAANDTLGQAASLNGGYGSSYAVSAAQQARNDYNQQLAALIPDMEQNAFNRWATDRDFDANQWYQNQSLYLDAVGANNSVAANQNADTLARQQFAWQKKQASKSKGGGGGGRGRRRGSSYGGSYRGGGGGASDNNIYSVGGGSGKSTKSKYGSAVKLLKAAGNKASKSKKKKKK